VLLLHCLQQRRLRARAGAVDLVRHQQLGEHRAGEKAEAALACGALLKNFGAENVGGHKVGRELDAPRVETKHGTHGLHELGLGEARHAEQKRMAAGKDSDERLLDDFVLAEDDRADGRFRGAHILRGRFSRAHDHVFELFEPFAGSGHGQLLV
jgi:hypothetical protein